MAKFMTKTVFTVGLLVMLLAVPAFGTSINKSIRIEAGSESEGASTVNGSISIGEKAVVSGDVSTVNGAIRVDSGARIKSASTVNGALRISDNVKSDGLDTVNGSVTVGESVTVDGAIEAVNGSISVNTGSTVASDVSNVNGQIELSGAQIGGNVSTVNGDIFVVDGSVIKGDLIVEKPGGWSWSNKMKREPKVVIGPGSSVVGNIDLERKVKLFISESAQVGGVTGVMTMDDAVRFSGKRP